MSSNSVLSSDIYMSRMLRISKKLSKTRKVKKKVACYHLENEFFTFSTLDVSSNEFSKRLLDTSTLHVNINLHLALQTLTIIQSVLSTCWLGTNDLFASVCCSETNAHVLGNKCVCYSETNTWVAPKWTCVLLQNKRVLLRNKRSFYIASSFCNAFSCQSLFCVIFYIFTPHLVHAQKFHFKMTYIVLILNFWKQSFFGFNEFVPTHSALCHLVIGSLLVATSLSLAFQNAMIRPRYLASLTPFIVLLP